MKKTQKRVKVLKVDPVIGSKYSQQGQHLELSCGHTIFRICHFFAKSPKTTICNICTKQIRELEDSKVPAF